MSEGNVEQRGEKTASDEFAREGVGAEVSVDADARAVGRALMPVAERFVSINGEGVRAGKLATFVRFAGCNLACSYCDTRWANEPGCDCEHLSVREVATWVRAQATPCVTLTGGEPLLQPLLPELVRELLGKESGVGSAAARAVAPVSATAPMSAPAPAHAPASVPTPTSAPEAPFVEIETNGAVSVAEIARLRDEMGLRDGGRLGLTLDYKLASSGMEDAMLLDNYEYVTCDDTVKFVAGSLEDLQKMRAVIARFGLCERCAVHVSPVFGALEPARIVDFVRENHLFGVTVQLQLHKIIWPHVEKGV